MSGRTSLFAELEDIYVHRAHRQYGLEDISQLQHALQAAALAEAQGEPPAFVLAALLHDVGHMIHKLGENPAGQGIDDRHEILGAKWLAKRMPKAVSEPVRLHVEAKRYLCAVDPDYMAQLAPDSVLSLKLQGGPMNAEEAARFRDLPFAEDALRLRRLDEAAKDPHVETPPVSHFLRHLAACHIGAAERESFRRDGVLVLRDFFGADEVAEIDRLSRAMGAEADEMLRLANDSGRPVAELAREMPDALIAVPEAADPMQLCRFEYLIGRNEEFRHLIETRIAPVIEAVTGEPFIPFKDKENEKHPGGGAFGPHQDFAAYQAFGPRYNVTAMISVDAATRENGCLEFASNWAAFAAAASDAVESRVEGRPLLRFHKGGAQNGDILDPIEQALDWQAVETSPLDLVLFDSFAPHRSAPNGSAASRRAMFLTFNAVREGDWYQRYYADKRTNFDDPKFHISTPT
ncbi:phosphonate degradation HD-domain oxygenase, partial [Parvibaculum sp.]|uniref:phosphonate degradation HD-domain oxygenase n=1 Tax=Parvibaculum sp. TaxID=2024848 RepID=UPI002C9F6242